MPNNPPELEAFRLACWNQVERFPLLVPPNEQIEAVSKDPRTLRAQVARLQSFLQESASELLYKTTSSIQAFMQQRIPGFGLNVGLVSTMQMAGPAVSDRGIPVYQFLIGADDMWNAYLSHKCDGAVPLDRIKGKLADGVALPQRLFGHRNATGALLSPNPPAEIDPQRRVAIPYEHSAGGIAGTGNKFVSSYPWALVSPLSFPMLYALIPRNNTPLGFLQMHIELPGIPDSDKYAGHEQAWLRIYNPSAAWAIDMAAFLAAFCNILLAPVLDRTILLRDHAMHSIETRFCFPDDFREAVHLRDEDVPWNPDTYGGSKWVQQIAHLHSLWREPTFPPAELAKNLIDLFWSEDTWRGLPPFDKRSEAEKLLFWSEKYRDHLVHILKVFLIGERIIREIHHGSVYARSVIDNTQLCDDVTTPLEAFEFQWMLAATVHDYSLPYELLPGLQKSYWREFVIPGDSNGDTEEDPATRDLEAMQFGLTLADRVLRQHLVVSLWQLLHSEVTPQGQESYPAYCHLHTLGKSGKNIGYPRFLSYFLENGDHGIASALWFLHLTMLDKKDDGTIIGLHSPNGQETEARCRQSIAVARACYFHNLATKRVKNDDNGAGEPIFAGNLFGPFEKDPLAYLLLLCDFLQDEGRDESTAQQSDSTNGWGKRPFGHVTKVEWCDGFLEIYVEYVWVQRAKNGKPPKRVIFGEDGCQKKEGVKCHRRQQTESKKPNCWFHDCKERAEIAKAFDLLAARLAGLPVKIYLAHEKKGAIEL